MGSHRWRLALLVLIGIVATGFVRTPRALAWGDEGHEVVALIADHYLTDAARAQVQALLADDTSKLVPGLDIATEATWADRYRDSDRNTTKVHYTQTEQWHFVDIERDGSADLDAACFGHPPVPAGKVASEGPAQDCVVDKVDEFAAELADSATSKAERLEALQFLLHFVGDLHQPLHASDDHDKGGNDKKVTSKLAKAGNLHHYWDVEFVAPLGADKNAIATKLISKITKAQQKAWSKGKASTWAQETFAVANAHAYKLPKPGADGAYALSDAYVAAAEKAAAQQLSRAGVRLAMLLNAALKK